MKLEVKNINFKYPQSNKSIITNFSIQANSSDKIAIMGNSGVGKTTLLKLIAGYENPQNGEILLDGTPISKIKGYSPIQLIFQHPQQVLNPKLKMADSLFEGGVIEQRIIDKLHISKEWYTRYPTELSGGELQRFCIARALGEGTKFLLADEISTMLDLITQSQIWNFILEEIEYRKIGLIMTSHSTELIDIICTKKINL